MSFEIIFTIFTSQTYVEEWLGTSSSLEGKLQDAQDRNHEKISKLSKQSDKSWRKVIAEAEIKLAKKRESRMARPMLKQ